MNWFAINPNLERYLADLGTWANAGQAISPTASSLIFRSVQIDDVDLIIEMHKRSSERTIFSRYHSPRMPTRQEITQICQLEGKNGRAVMTAIAGKKPRDVGMAYYINVDVETAEVALLVEDSFQGQGVGKRLLCWLTELALAQGIVFFEAFVLPTNKPALHLLQQMGRVVQNKLVYGARELQIELTAVTSQNVRRE